ncbi:unnamed protein product [Schistosoma curassoni]|uniref:Secreted protein n=1 Tax=Schistosoma curassoni TaxID=6186 RepID=A0A183JBI7_9TREM|nr:unnamed protein product [Schistosoma curassoni]
MVSGQRTFMILFRQLLRNTCTVVVLLISAPYNRTVLTFVLKILTSIMFGSCFEFHMFFNYRDVVLTLPIFAFTSAPDLPRSSIMLSRYGKVSTSSRASASSVVKLMFSLLY